MYVYYVYSLPYRYYQMCSFSAFPDKILVYLPNVAWQTSTFYSIYWLLREMYKECKSHKVFKIVDCRDSKLIFYCLKIFFYSQKTVQ